MEVPESSLLNHIHKTITICTDASYDNYLRVGSWACYMKSDNKLIKTGKIIESHVENSTEAERVGVASALWLVSKAVDIKTHRIIIYCDNESAMRPVRLSNKTGAKKQRAKQQLEFYQKNIEPVLQRAGGYEIRHVKGHLERNPRMKRKTRHFMNDWCDKEAKRLLTEYRESVK